MQSISMWSIDLFGPMASTRLGQDGWQSNNNDWLIKYFQLAAWWYGIVHTWAANPNRYAQSIVKHCLLNWCILVTINICHSVNVFLFSYLTGYRAFCAPHSLFSGKQMKWTLQKREPKIRTISCHRRIKSRSNAWATTLNSAYMWADVVLLKLHCRPNDLDCWVETLAGSQSHYCLYMLGVNHCCYTRLPF